MMDKNPVIALQVTRRRISYGPEKPSSISNVCYSPLIHADTVTASKPTNGLLDADCKLQGELVAFYFRPINISLLRVAFD